MWMKAIIFGLVTAYIMPDILNKLPYKQGGIVFILYALASGWWFAC